MEKINRMRAGDRQKLESEFKKAMRAAAAIFGVDAFRKRYTEDADRSPVSKALFEAWSVQLARCSPAQIVKLVAKKKQIATAFRELMRVDRDFERAISLSTGDPKRVEKRFRAIEKLVMRFV